jgi:dihydroorotate dehydrogenase
MDTLLEVVEWAKVLRGFGLPILLKLNIGYRVAQLGSIAKSPFIDALVMGNAIRFDDAPRHGIDRVRIFGTDVSPLAKFGGGAISGHPLLKPTLAWMEEARLDRFPMRVIAGGGIGSTEDASDMLMAGYPVVCGIEAATIFMARPWNVQQTIDDVNTFFAEKNKERA